MERVLVITDSTSSDQFAVVTEKNGSLRFFGISEAGKEWSQWINASTNGRGRLDDIVKKLTLGLMAEGPKPMTRKVRSELAENLPKVSESTHEELTTGRVESKSLESHRAVSRSGLSQKQWNARINYKALSFTNDRNFSTISYDLKSARAVFDPDLAGGNGGFRCPVGTRYGGQITDRYGRGCGWGAARRIVNAVGDGARRAERRLDDRRKRRVERRNARVGRRIGGDKPGRSRRGFATRLDNFADRRDQRQGRDIADRLDEFADRRDERQGISPRRRRGAGSPPAAARRRRAEELVDEPAPQTARERRRSASVDRVNDQPSAAKKPATVPAVERQRPAKKAVAKKRAVKKVPAKKAPAKKAPAKKAPAKKAAVKKVAAKKAPAKRSANAPEAQERRRLDGIENNLKDWVDGVADDRERLKVIEAFEEEKKRLRREAADAASGKESALEQEYALYDAAIRRLRERNLPPPPRFDPDANANQRRTEGDEQASNLSSLSSEDRAWVQQQVEAVYMSSADRERANNGIIKEESIENLEQRIRRIEQIEIPLLRRKANDEDLPKRDRAFYAEGLAIEEQRMAAYKAGIERKRELVPAEVPQSGLSPEQMAKLEKDMAKRYAGLRKKRGGIVGRWMIKTYGDEDPPPWKTDKNIKIDELRDMMARRSPEDKARINEWVKQVYAIDEVVGRSGLRFRVQIEDRDIDTSGGEIAFSGRVQAFNPDTNQWENIGKVDRNIRPNSGMVYNARLMLGAQGGHDNPFANGAKNEGFTSVFNPHAFTWLKASGFDRADVSAAADGRFVWGRFGYRQSLSEQRAGNLAKALMEEVKRYREGGGDGLIRTDLDADLIEYLTTVAKQKNFTIDAPQHPEYILALAGDANFTEDEKKAYDKKLQEWFVAQAPFGSGKYDFTDENVPDDPRKLV
jgi:hypothetical protein